MGIPAEVVEEQSGVYIPSDVASSANAEVGDVLSSLSFSYTTESKFGEFDEGVCDEVKISTIEENDSCPTVKKS